MLKFIVVWFGQLISLIGSGLTNFALAIFFYQSNNSVTLLTNIHFFAVLPYILISPIAGVIIDRWGCRPSLQLSNIGASIATLFIAFWTFKGYPQVWPIFLAIGVIATFDSFRWPAFSALSSMLVPKEHLNRVGGLFQFALAMQLIIAPMLAGWLITTISIQAVISIDFITFLFAIITLLSITVSPGQLKAQEQDKNRSWIADMSYGWTYVNTRPGLLLLLLLFFVINFSFAMVRVLMIPLVLSLSSSQTLGLIGSVGGIGLLIGSLIISIFGGPKRRIHWILLLSLFQGMILTLGGFKPNIPLIALAASGFLFIIGVTFSLNQAIWQCKIPLAVQGRVFAVREMIAMSALPLAYLIAGPLADRVFEPLMKENNLLTNTVGRVIGIGPGRGIGLIFLLLGLLIIVTVIASRYYPRLLLLEDELPDAIVEQKNTTSGTESTTSTQV